MKILFLACLLIAGHAFGQTRLIAHKSHSGTAASFAAACEGNLFDREDSDFGLPSNYPVDRVDSVIYVSDSVAVMVRTKGRIFVKQKGEIYDEQKRRDTLVNHPLFQNRHALDSIRKAWYENFESSNPVDQIRFIGFDNKKPKAKKGKRSALPVVIGKPSQPGNNGGLLIGLTLFSGLAALLVHLRRRPLHQPVLNT